MIDSHLHMELNNWSEEKLMHYLDSQGIEKAWILTWDEAEPAVPGYYQALDIEFVKKVFKKFPDRIVPFYAPDPARPDWKEKLESCLDDGFAGCGELKVSYNWDDPRIESLLEYLNKNKLILIFHTERPRKMFIPKVDRGFDWFFKRAVIDRTNGRGSHLMNRISTSTGFMKKYLDKRQVEFPGYLHNLEVFGGIPGKYPDIKFIAHGPDFWNHFRIPEKDYLVVQKGRGTGKGLIWDLLRQHANLYCDISGYTAYTALTRDKNITKEFINEFHSKILFGTDNREPGLYDFIKGLKLTEEVEHAILDGNARSLIS